MPRPVSTTTTDETTTTPEDIMPQPTETTNEATEPTYTPVQLVERVTETSREMRALLDSLTNILCDREAVVAIASDALLAGQACDQIEEISNLIGTVRIRLESTRELSRAIDRLADPLLLRNVN